MLAAAAFHAGWNRLLHDVEDRLAAMAVAGLVAAVLLSPALVVAPPRGAGWLIPLSAAAEVAYALALTAAYRRGALSLAYPLARGTAPLLVTAGAWIALGQGVRPLALAGTTILAVGLALVAVSARAARRGGAVAFAVLTGCCIAAYSVVDARAVHSVSAPGYLGAVLGLQGLALLAVTRPGAVRLRAAARPGVLIGVGTVGAYLLVLLAFQRADAGPVATLRELSVLLGLLLARDRPRRATWAGAALVVAGAGLAAG